MCRWNCQSHKNNIPLLISLSSNSFLDQCLWDKSVLGTITWSLDECALFEGLGFTVFNVKSAYDSLSRMPFFRLIPAMVDSVLLLELERVLMSATKWPIHSKQLTPNPEQEAHITYDTDSIVQFNVACILADLLAQARKHNWQKSLRYNVIQVAWLLICW